MKKILTSIFALALSVGVFAQADTNIFVNYTEHPSFPGGEQALMDFFKSNIRYPEADSLKGIQGTIYVTFIIDTVGAVSDVRIIRGLAPELDAEVVRVVEMMPRWIPGKRRDRPVKVQFNMPFHVNRP